MPKIGSLRKVKQQLLASVVHFKLLNAALVWASALDNHSIQKRLSSTQKGIAMRIISAYRSVLMNAVLILENVPLKICINCKKDKKGNDCS